MDESVAVTEDPLAEIRTRLEVLYTSENSRAEDIIKAIGKIEADCSEEYGHLAEFWLLLAVGHKLADPLPVYGHKSSTYFDKAHACAAACEIHTDDHYAEMQRKYLELEIQQLQARADRPTAQMSWTEANKYRRAAASASLLYERLYHSTVYAS